MPRSSLASSRIRKRFYLPIMSNVPITATETAYLKRRHGAPHSSSAPTGIAKGAHRPHQTLRTLIQMRSSRLHALKASGLTVFEFWVPYFAKDFELVGVILPFSLVLDKAAFAQGVEIRNVDVKGDVSFDSSLILNQFKLIRSHIKGSLFSDGSFIDRLSLGNTIIDLSASFTQSVLFESAEFYNVTISKELSVRGSALGYFITQFSKIGGILDLSSTAKRGVRTTLIKVISDI